MGDGYVLKINVGDLRKDEMSAILDYGSKALILLGAALEARPQGTATRVGSFTRSIPLPSDVDVNQVRSLGLRDDGTLSFRLAKRADEEEAAAGKGGALVEGGGGAGAGGGYGGSGGIMTSSSMSASDGQVMSSDSGNQVNISL